MRSALSRGLFLAVVLIVIALLTLWPQPGQPSLLLTTCLACGDHGLADFLLNVLLFVPFGAALGLLGERVPRATLWGALLSTAIEIAQLYIPGRDSSIGDVIANTTGTAIGAWLLTISVNWWFPGNASRRSQIAAGIAIALCFVTGFLLTPAFPDSRYYAQWTPNLGHLQWYRGRVRSATLDGVRLPAGPLRDSPRVRGLLAADSGFTLRVIGAAGPRPTGLAPFFAIYDDQRREILLLGPDRDDLVFRIRTRAAALRFDRPDLRLIDALHGVAPRDTLDITVRARAGRYDVRRNGAPPEQLGFTVGSGWGLFLYPESLPAWLKRQLGILWIAFLFLPAGFWCRTRVDTIGALAAAVAALLGAPMFTALVRTPPEQWVGAATGFLAGLALHVGISRTSDGARDGL